MRICLVSREFAPFWGAGIGTYASQMAAAWQAAGHETHVLCPAYPRLAERGRRLRPGVIFHGLDLNHGPDVVTWDAYRFDFLRHAMGVYRMLLDLHERHAFDYIEFPDYWGEGYFALRARQTLGRFRGAVLGVRLHTPSHECREVNRDAWLDERAAYLEHAEDESMRLADVLVSPSQSLLEKVRTRLGDAAAPGRVVPYPFDHGAAHAEMGGGDAQSGRGDGALPEVLYFGRIEYRKGVHLLVEAAQRLLDEGIPLRLRLVGKDTASGPSGRALLPHIQKRVRPQWHDRIVFERARPRGALGTLIRQSTLCCFPSLWENFPNACLEAMALGAAVVGSDAGGMSEIIEDGRSGVLFRSGDVDALASALRTVLRDEALRKRIAAQAPQRIATLCEPSSVVRAMEEVIGQCRAAAPRSSDVVVGDAPAREAPLVSFIVPHYNLGLYLPEALESIRGQTVDNYEVVLVDDGSTDPASLAVVAEAEAGRFGPVRIVRKPNGGLSSARNAGVAAASGQWIVPLDADDVLAPTFLETMFNAARRHPGITFVTSLVADFVDTWGDAAAGWIPLGIDRDILACRNCASCCTALIDRASIIDAGGYDEWLTSYEDWDLYCTLAARGARALVVPEFLIGYRIRPESMLRTEGRSRDDPIRAYLYAKHAGLSQHPDRSMRLQLAPDQAECRAQRMIAENIRYRVADRINDMLKKARVQSRIKGLATRIIRNGEDRHP